jgi:hypothetical protein
MPLAGTRAETEAVASVCTVAFVAESLRAVTEAAARAHRATAKAKSLMLSAVEQQHCRMLNVLVLVRRCAADVLLLLITLTDASCR